MKEYIKYAEPPSQDPPPLQFMIACGDSSSGYVLFVAIWNRSASALVPEKDQHDPQYVGKC